MFRYERPNDSGAVRSRVEGAPRDCVRDRPSKSAHPQGPI